MLENLADKRVKQTKIGSFGSSFTSILNACLVRMYLNLKGFNPKLLPAASMGVASLWSTFSPAHEVSFPQFDTMRFGTPLEVGSSRCVVMSVLNLIFSPSLVGCSMVLQQTPTMVPGWTSQLANGF